MHYNTRVLRILSFLLLAVFLTTSCQTDTLERTSLSIWLDPNEQEMRYFKRRIHAIEKARPELQIRLRFVDLMELKPRFQGQVGETREPDILYMMNDWVGELAEQNLLRPFTRPIEDKLPQALKSMHYQGKQYGMPIVLQTVALFYNRNLVPAAPENLSEMKELQRSDEIYTFLYDQQNFYYHAPWFHACGGRIFDKDGKFVLSQTENKRALLRSLQQSIALRDQGLVPQGSSYNVMSNLFNAGQASLMMNGAWALSDLKENQVDYAVAPLPSLGCPDVPRPFIGVKGFGLNNLSRNPQLAEEVIFMLAEPESQEAVLSELDNLPVQASLYKGKLPREKAAFVSQIEQGIPMPNHPLMKYIWLEMNWLMSQALAGEDLTRKIDEALERLEKRHESN